MPTPQPFIGDDNHRRHLCRGARHRALAHDMRAAAAWMIRDAHRMWADALRAQEEARGMEMGAREGCARCGL